MRRSLPGVLLATTAGLALAACAGTRVASGDAAKPWPESLAPGEGAVLFGSDVAPPTRSLDWFTGYSAFFYASGDPSGVARVWVKLSDKGGKPLDDLFLVAVPAGSYAYTRILAIAPKGSPFLSVPGDSFEHFTVRPGEVAVLGTIHAAIDVTKSWTVLSSETSWERRVDSTVDRDTKVKLIDEALGRAQGTSGWTGMLSKAKTSLP